MDKAYEPKKYEENILKKWNAAKAFLPKTPAESKTKKKFTVPIPPPNVTGTLHLGHAMMVVMEDIMTRYHRMKGDATLWLPGTDHAAIATESVVLKNLGVPSREIFSREEFLEKCFDHTKKSQATITNQVKKMGASCDFTRERYTMDLGMSNAVWKIFKDLYEMGLIVRGYRMVNWSTKAQSVLADDELEWEDRKEAFFYIKCGRFVMGTVRAETKCADSPLVIHPDENYVVARFAPFDSVHGTVDERNRSQEFVFSEVLFDDTERRNKIFNQLGEGTWEKISVHPGKFFEGEEFEAETYSGKRNFFVLCDAEVIDINKGTGAMTISVNHSADDYFLAKKYPEKLKNYYIEKVGFDGKMTKIAGELEGIEVEIARKRAGKLMAEKGILVGIDKDYVHNVPLCYRTGCVVEPMISPQWFIDVNKEFLWQENVGAVKAMTNQLQNNEKPIKTTLKKLTLEAITQHGGETNIIPDRFVKIYDQWIENLQDWCISRQIWWGHQIPVWYDENGNEFAAHEQKLLFVRHGESENNVKRVIGQDSSLTDNGRKQAEELTQKLIAENRNITRIFCSSQKRSKETAEIVFHQLKIANSKLEIEITEFPDFHEIFSGHLDGTPQTEESTMRRCIQENTGESLEEIENRAKKFWQKLSEMEPQDGEILFIGHRSFLSMIFAVKDGRFGETLLDYNDRWTMQNGEMKEVCWMMKPKGVNLLQDQDTLDTWFSSALWPFSTLGWPDKTPDFKNFYPTSILETGHDILFFWVARMIMFGRFATGKNPFKDVYLHGLVCDEHGKKMSKSKGNGIDPLEMIEKFGTDALRMSLVVGTTPGNQVNLGEKKIEGFRNFANKIWNISRYILQLSMSNVQFSMDGFKIQNSKLSLPEQWILSKTQNLIEEVTEGLENHKYGEVGQKLYDFAWNDLADWAIESAKAVESETIGNTLRYVLENLLKLLHPYMPFITEVVFEEFKIQNSKFKIDDLLLLQAFPEINSSFKNPKAEEQFEILQGVITSIRSLRSASKVDPVKKISAVLNGKNMEFLKENEAILLLLARLENVKFEEIPTEECVRDMVNGTEIFLPLSGMVDANVERQRKEKELFEAKKLLQNLEGRLANEKYMASAPQNLVEQTRKQHAEVLEKIRLLQS